ncbi:unnamed protein product [Mycena citricolor]|uniref:C2H2-type domain-containing protein n=1 Tax=Mycena citricolor TaxID=2018698 RepID=A0AAD2HXX2_9AGAR|nr:unnamed protein product [Mycena citricolor]
MSTHITSQHTTRRPHACPICSYTTGDPSSAVRHRKIHIRKGELAADEHYRTTAPAPQRHSNKTNAISHHRSSNLASAAGSYSPPTAVYGGCPVFSSSTENFFLDASQSVHVRARPSWCSDDEADDMDLDSNQPSGRVHQ